MEPQIEKAFRYMLDVADGSGEADIGELDELFNEEIIEELERRGLAVYIGPGRYMVPTQLQPRFSGAVVEKAHHIIADGLVAPAEGEERDDIWRVKEYTVISDGKTYGTCTCPHGEKGTPVGVSTCKHVFAVMMTVRDLEQK